MRRVVVFLVASAIVMLGFRGLRGIAFARAMPLMEHLMENVMPSMMDSCFAAMSPERREFMLGHCRGMLNRVEAKYVAGK